MVSVVRGDKEKQNMGIYKKSSDVERAVRLAGQTIINRASEIAGAIEDMDSLDINISIEQDSKISLSWNKYLSILPPHLLDEEREVAE